MYRNLDYRSEVAVPIYDTDLQEELKRYVSIQLRDNCKARLLNIAGEENAYVKSGRKNIVRAQQEIYKWLTTKHFAESRFKTFLQHANEKQMHKGRENTIGRPEKTKQIK
jgi:polyphosphate kinase